MKNMAVIAAVSHKGSLCSIATERPADLPVGDEESVVMSLPEGREICRWKGWMLTAACATGDLLVCPAVDGHVYLLNEGGLKSIHHDQPDDWYHAAACLEDDRCLFGGDMGRLAWFNGRTSRFQYSSLKEHGVRRPGRSILKILVVEQDIYLLGENELLVQYRDQEFIECYSPEKRSERWFWDGVVLEGKWWIDRKSVV